MNKNLNFTKEIIDSILDSVKYYSNLPKENLAEFMSNNSQKQIQEIFNFQTKEEYEKSYGQASNATIKQLEDETFNKIYSSNESKLKRLVELSLDILTFENKLIKQKLNSQEVQKIIEFLEYESALFDSQLKSQNEIIDNLLNSMIQQWADSVELDLVADEPEEQEDIDQRVEWMKAKYVEEISKQNPDIFKGFTQQRQLALDKIHFNNEIKTYLLKIVNEK